MGRFVEKRIKDQVYKGKISPKPNKIHEKEVGESRTWSAKWARGTKFEVGTYPKNFVIDLDEVCCCCRFWQLTRI